MTETRERELGLRPSEAAEAGNTTALIGVRSADFDAFVEQQAEDLRDALEANGFKGALGDSFAYGEQLFVGLGSGNDPFAWASALRPGRKGLFKFDAPPGDAELAALGWALGGYRFERYKTGKALEAELAAPEGVDVELVGIYARAVFLARDLVNTPTNDLGSEQLAATARRVAEAHGAKVCVVCDPQEVSEAYPLIHAVGRAAKQAPRLIDFAWGDEGAPRVTLVGKGVCFDSGGLNLKPDSGMALMKKDMGGAANTLALAQMIMAAKLNVRLRVLIPAVENAVSSDSFRPGDVYTSRKGLSVEIGHTDAEGRLILADALALAEEEAPDLLLDFATLTGAARVALGPEIAPFYTVNDALAEEISTASGRMNDPLWRMPLWAPYDSWLDSRVADLNNITDGGFAGSITAALFLQRFVDRPENWAHFDLYAWNAKPRPGRPIGGEAQAIRAVFDVLRRRFGRED